MNSKIPKIITAILILLNSVVFAQTEDNLRSYKFNEFGTLQESDWKVRLDRLVEMQNSIPNSKLGIIIYAERGKSLTSIEEIVMLYENYLLHTKKIKQKHINISRGGFRYSQFTELWVVPQNADYPLPTPVEKFEAEMFAELGYAVEIEVKEKTEEFIKKFPQPEITQGYIISYGNPEEVAKRERLIRDSPRFRYHPPRIVFVNGGESETLKTFF
ncbi:MAG: hypothetical protein ACR2MD_14335 [Aridibacter sp.]